MSVVDSVNDIAYSNVAQDTSAAGGSSQIEIAASHSIMHHLRLELHCRVGLTHACITRLQLPLLAWRTHNPRQQSSQVSHV